jgi:cadherin-like protein
MRARHRSLALTLLVAPLLGCGDFTRVNAFGITSTFTPLLGNLEVNAGVLTPNFDPNVTSYTVLVSGTTTAIRIRPSFDPAQAVVLVNGERVPTGVDSSDIPLNIGTNVIPVEVRDNAGALRTYSVSVVRGG